MTPTRRPSPNGDPWPSSPRYSGTPQATDRIAHFLVHLDQRTAAARAAGDTVFTEPQLNGWYRLHGDRVRPLNAAALRSGSARWPACWWPDAGSLAPPGSSPRIPGPRCDIAGRAS